MSGSLVFLLSLFIFYFFASHLSAAPCCGLPALLAAKVPETVNGNRSYHGKRNEAEVSLWIHEARRNIWEQRGLIH